MPIRSLRGCAACFLFFAVSLAAAQQPSPPDAPQSQSDRDQAIEKEKEIEKQEQSQRLLGVVPMFSVTHHNALPMSPREKLHLAAKSAVDPFVFTAAGIQAGISQATGGFPGYGQGAAGYGKRYGAALADASSSNLFSNFLYPVMLKEDPRYFRAGQGGVRHRIGAALAQVVTGYKDDGEHTFNWSNVLGALSTGALSNVYYPPGDRGLGLTLSRTGISLLYGGLSNMLSEYWPEIQAKVHPRHDKQDAGAQ